VPARSDAVALLEVGKRSELCGVGTQPPVDERSGKTQALQCARRGRITYAGLRAKDLLKRIVETFGFLDRSIAHRSGCSFAIDAFSDQFSYQARVADRLALLLDVELCEEAVIDVALALASFDGGARVAVGKSLALELLPKLRLGEAALR